MELQICRLVNSQLNNDFTDFVYGFELKFPYVSPMGITKADTTSLSLSLLDADPFSSDSKCPIHVPGAALPAHLTSSVINLWCLCLRSGKEDLLNTEQRKAYL